MALCLELGRLVDHSVGTVRSSKSKNTTKTFVFFASRAAQVTKSLSYTCYLETRRHFCLIRARVNRGGSDRGERN
jgi:hypothetical protein